MTGLVIDGTGFEVLAGEDRIGSRRAIGPADVALLETLAARYVRAVQAGRYVRAVQAGADEGTFVMLGRELYAWLDGDTGQLGGLLERAESPLVFQVQGPRSPSVGAWAVLRAPWELLARAGEGFLAKDGLTRFCVARRLGPPRPPAELGGFRLGLAFMASSPRGQRELDFEFEEAAILAAVGETRLDLLVEDTGDPQQLAQRLADVGGMPVVHLSCHGLNNWRDKPGSDPRPVLMMEDELGTDRPTKATDLVGLLVKDSPGVGGSSSGRVASLRLLFVSACLTATGADATGHLPCGASDEGGPGAATTGNGLVAHSLATALVAAGVPAVIGWDGSVNDHAATAFAKHLYAEVADRADLAVAVGDTRRALLVSGEPRVRADWHLARLWLGPTGGGTLVAGNCKRSLVPATHGTKTFLAGKQDVPVAAAEMFVGRRPELQQSLRALRSGERAGVLLHGQGRLGKSSLAARIADRYPDRAVAVVFGDYSPLAILDVIASAVRTDPDARSLIEERLPEVRQRPEAIEAVLIDLLAGPCRQTHDGHRALLLIIDDLEQILRPDLVAAHRVNDEHAPVLAAVLRAFDPDETDSRLLVTSRFTFTLSGLERRLEPVQLRPLSPVAQQKLQRRQRDITPADRQEKRAGLADRAVRVSRGNPGLQDLIGLRLVYGADVPLERAEAAVAGMEAYLQQGELPSDSQVREYLENLALDTLLDQAGPTSRDLLRAITLFDLPVPTMVIDILAAQVGGSPTRLQGLGLLDLYQDPYHPGRPALAANPLAIARITPLTATEQAALAAIAVNPLFTAWNSATPLGGRSGELDLQLARLALLADDCVVTAACTTGAVHALRSGPAVNACQLGLDAIRLLDHRHQPVPLGLLRAAADAALTSGDGMTGPSPWPRPAAIKTTAACSTRPASSRSEPATWSQVVTRTKPRSCCSKPTSCSPPRDQTPRQR